MHHLLRQHINTASFFFDWAILSDRKIALRQVNAGCASKNTALTEKVWQNPTTGPHE